MLFLVLFVLFFFFFKQKTAYEMRISDWSSDVCSSDLGLARPRSAEQQIPEPDPVAPIPGGPPCRDDEPALVPDAALRRVDAAHPSSLASLCRGARAHRGVASQGPAIRSEDRRVGKECVSTCRSRGTP